MVSAFERNFANCWIEAAQRSSTVWGNDDRTIALLIHVDDLIVTGTDSAMESLQCCRS